MRAYSTSSEEALRTRSMLKDWSSEGFLTEAQYQLMERETVCELRRTNIFLRLVLFLFTLIIVGAAIGLFFTVIVTRPETQTTGIFLLIFAAVSYAAAELAVSQARLYRYGIEEAFAACSVGLLCAGIWAVWFSSSPYSQPDRMEFLIPAAGAILSLWIWHRFGFPYTFLAAMICVCWMPGSWTPSPAAQHLTVAAFYAAGLIAVAALRLRQRFTYLNDVYSIAEALLWGGIYLAINLQLTSINWLGQWWLGPQSAAQFSRPFYWTTWALTWCIPPALLARGLFRKDRLVIAVGAVVAVLTLATNKPYLGLPRQTWDPMLLGALLIGAALIIRRWLAGGPGGVRHGFTARRLSGKDKSWMDAGGIALGLASPHSIAVKPSFHFGGGDSGGGGASSDW